MSVLLFTCVEQHISCCMLEITIDGLEVLRWRVWLAVISVALSPHSFRSCCSYSNALLSRIWQRFSSHLQVPKWEAHDWVFYRLSFAIMRGVSQQLIGRQLAEFSWWFLRLLLMVSVIWLFARCTGLIFIIIYIFKSYLGLVLRCTLLATLP